MLRTCSLIMALSLFACPIQAQESTLADFHEFCKTIEGRWIGQVTQVVNLPGFGEEGEVGTVHFQSRMLADNHCLLAEFYGAGEGCGNWILAYDPANKRITSLALFSNGRRADGVISKQNGKWQDSVIGTNADGSQDKIVSVLTITENGQTHTWTDNGTAGDKKLDEVNSVWRRVHPK